MTINTQFYPTPTSLAHLAFRTFKDEKIIRMLEPSAGRGDLIEHLQGDRGCWSGHQFPIDCIEIDLDNQAILREGKYNVIDGDFLAYNGRGAMYSHIIMNPPFNAGAKHVLKAWNILFSGEIVAIINAETVREPRTAQAKLLVKLIEDHGEVSYHKEQFVTEDTERKTKVEIALVWLGKAPNLVASCWTIEDAMPDQSNLDRSDMERAPVNGVNRQQVAISEPVIKQMVRAFNLAILKIQAAEMAEEEARYYENMLWSEFSGHEKPTEGAAGAVQGAVNDRYDKLRDSAWRKVLTTTEFTDRMSSEAQRRLESQFVEVSKMEFTVANIYGLLSGLVAQKPQMDADMICDVFDLITKFHSANRAYYRGWSSNDKHREHAYRLKMSRFILHVGSTGWGIDWNQRQTVADIEKVFGLMDGQPGTDLSMTELLSDHKRINGSGRHITTYFDFRYYKGAGTLHVYPRRKDLMDRLNRTVGRVRRWLPDEAHSSDPKFWAQYDDAEKVTARMDKIDAVSARSRWDHRKTDDLHEAACKALGMDLSGTALSWAGEDVPLLADIGTW